MNIKDDIRVTDIWAGKEARIGTVITFTYDNGINGPEDYQYEVGSDGRGSLSESLYLEREDQEQLEAFMEEVLDLWVECYTKYVAPAIETAVHTARIGVEDTIQMIQPGEGLT